MTRLKWTCCGMALLLTTLASVSAAEQQTKVLMDFEKPSDWAGWERRDGSRPTAADLSKEHATHGAGSARVDPKGMLRWVKVPDWSGYDELLVDIFVDGDSAVRLRIVVGDKDWANHPKEPRVYNNRHNDERTLVPGANTVSIPVNGLFRGQIGYRNKDLKYNIKPNEIVRFDLDFEPRGPGVRGIYVDYVRLAKGSVPPGILALDFGPERQSVFPGFTPISPKTVYGANGATAGFAEPVEGAEAGRDDGFPTRLYGDYVNAADQEFIANVPNGSCEVWVMYCGTGEWNWLTPKFRRRAIEANGRVVHEENPDENGRTDYLFRFENVEPRPGSKPWDLYVANLFTPVRFTVPVQGGKLKLRFESDGQLGSKLAAVIAYPSNLKETGQAYVAEVEQGNRLEFERRAVCLDPAPAPVTATEDERRIGWQLGYPALDQRIRLMDAPGPAQGSLRYAAVGGQVATYTFTVRPLRDFNGPAQLRCSDLKGPAGTIPASRIECRYTHHTLLRGLNEISYSLVPDSVRRVAKAKLALSKDLTRQFWIVVNVPDDARPGQYSGQVTLEADQLAVQLPLALEVLDVTLQEPQFAMGFFGLGDVVPAEFPESQREAMLRELCGMLRKSGMNSFAGGPHVPFSGLDAAGKPKLDFAACDRFLRIVQECGMGSREVFNYNGPGSVTGLHDTFVIGPTGHRWEQQTGKPFAELVGLAWGTLRDHARQANWPTIKYCFTDEPRILDQVRNQLELMKLYRSMAPWVPIGGFYSVNWERKEPVHLAIQEMFRTLVWEGLGDGYTQQDLDKGREYSREIYMYNQGQSRYSFGAYQFAQIRKGVRGRVEWHMLCLHGYQFFHLDGREPDTHMINWGREEVIPAVALYRCREGAYDFRYAATLWEQASRKKGTPVADAALAWLESVNQSIPAGANRPASDFMSNDAFRATCIEHLRKLQAAR